MRWTNFRNQPPAGHRYGQGGSFGGFTLIELLIVVVIMGILAATTIPQFQRDNQESKATQLRANLKIMRVAIELYYTQHNEVYPGAVSTDGSGEAVSSAAQAALAFEDQLLLYSDQLGGTSPTPTIAYRYGPYLKHKIPANPFNQSNEVSCDVDNPDINFEVADDSSGWKFYVKTGVFHANTGPHKTY